MIHAAGPVYFVDHVIYLGFHLVGQGFNIVGPAKGIDHIAQVSHPIDLNPFDRGSLPCIFFRKDQPGESPFLCIYSHGKGSPYSSQRPIQGKFPDNDKIL